jgi:hypothetical protein
MAERVKVTKAYALRQWGAERCICGRAKWQAAMPLCDGCRRQLCPEIQRRLVAPDWRAYMDAVSVLPHLRVTICLGKQPGGDN